ncbi:hypothetical protein B0H19DRAFT_1082110 [Mycena capillaripes]|nr:hypothetical protein B0H19DRAFT_1082110 [Mycena capillaripes]
MRARDTDEMEKQIMSISNCVRCRQSARRIGEWAASETTVNPAANLEKYRNHFLDAQSQLRPEDFLSEEIERISGPFSWATPNHMDSTLKLGATVTAEDWIPDMRAWPKILFCFYQGDGKENRSVRQSLITSEVRASFGYSVCLRETNKVFRVERQLNAGH